MSASARAMKPAKAAAAYQYGSAPRIDAASAAAASAGASHTSRLEGRISATGRSLARRFDLLEQAFQDGVGVAAFELELRRRRNAMAQRRKRHALDIVRRHEVAPLEERSRARRPHQRDAAARPGAGRDSRPAA